MFVREKKKKIYLYIKRNPKSQEQWILVNVSNGGIIFK